MKRYLFFIFFILVSSAFIVAQTTEFSVSRNLEGYNVDPSICIDQATGKGVIVWVNLDNSDRHTVYAAYVKYKAKKDKLKIRKPRVIANEGKEYKFTRVAYNSVSDSFLAAWQIGDSMGGKPLTFQVRKLNKKGKPDGAIKTVVNDPAFQDQKVNLIATVQQGANPAAANSEYMLAWYRNPGADFDLRNDAGLWTTIVDEDGKIVQPPSIQVNTLFAGFEPMQMTVGDIVQLDNGNYLVSYGMKSFVVGAPEQVRITLLDPAGYLIKDTSYSTDQAPNTTRLLATEKGLAIFSWSYYSTTTSDIKKCVLDENNEPAGRNLGVGTGQHFTNVLAKCDGKYYHFITDLNHETTIYFLDKGGREIQRTQTLKSTTPIKYFLEGIGHEASKSIFLLTGLPVDNTKRVTLQLIRYQNN